MIVCSCNVLTDHDVRTAVRTSEEPLTTGEVYGCLGCSRQCGRCARTIKKIMTEIMTDACATPCTLDHQHHHGCGHDHHDHDHHHHGHEHRHHDHDHPAPAFTLAAAAA